MKSHLNLFALCFLSCLVFASTSQAYFSTIDTGEILKKGTHQVSLEPQLILDKYNGFNLNGRFDTGLNESSNIRGLIGVGKVDFQVGGFYKWIPVPDLEDQPAIGLDIGAIYAKVGGDGQLSLRLHPLISKRFESEVGDFTPYAALPLGLTIRDDKSVTPVQLAFGTEMRPLNYKNISFFAELGINVSEAFSYISGAVTYRFQDAN